MKRTVESEFPDGKVEVIRNRDTETTGNFEVTLLETGELIHSRRDPNLGGGRLNSEPEKERLFSILRRYFAEGTTK